MFLVYVYSRKVLLAARGTILNRGGVIDGQKQDGQRNDDLDDRDCSGNCRLHEKRKQSVCFAEVGELNRVCIRIDCEFSHRTCSQIRIRIKVWI